MPAPFPVPLAELVGLFIECILFGVTLCSFAACLHVLIFTGRRINTYADRLILGVVVSMGIIATMNVSIFFSIIVDAFIRYTGPGGPIRIFANIAHWTAVVQGYLYGTQTLLGDAILIYRCRKVYFDSWLVIAFPILMWFGIFVCVISGGIIESQLGQESSLTAAKLAPFGTGFQSLSFSLNIIVTSMIARKIWRTYTDSVQYVNTGSSNGTSSMLRAMWTIIESGAIYSTALLILIVVYALKSPANIPMSAAMIQIIPIVFNTMLIRVHSKRSSEGSVARHQASTIAFADNSHNSGSMQTRVPEEGMQFKKGLGKERSFATDSTTHRSNTSIQESPV